jgi:hypothetical protein
MVNVSWSDGGANDEVVSLYQDKAFIPAIEAISIWDGIKTVISVFLGRE